MARGMKGLGMVRKWSESEKEQQRLGPGRWVKPDTLGGLTGAGSLLDNQQQDSTVQMALLSLFAVSSSSLVALMRPAASSEQTSLTSSSGKDLLVTREHGQLVAVHHVSQAQVGHLQWAAESLWSWCSVQLQAAFAQNCNLILLLGRKHTLWDALLQMTVLKEGVTRICF